MMVGHHPIYGVALMSLNAPEAVTCFWCLVQVVFAGSMGSPASPPGIYAPGLRRFYASQAKPVEQPSNRWGALATPAQPQRSTGCPTFQLMHSPCRAWSWSSCPQRCYAVHFSRCALCRLRTADLYCFFFISLSLSIL